VLNIYAGLTTNLDYSFDANNWDITVTACDLSTWITAPVSGDVPDTVSSIGAKDAAKAEKAFSVSSISWYDVTNSTAYSGTSFALSTVYRATVTLRANTGYTFSGLASKAFSYTGDAAYTETEISTDSTAKSIYSPAGSGLTLELKIVFAASTVSTKALKITLTEASSTFTFHTYVMPTHDWGDNIDLPAVSFSSLYVSLNGSDWTAVTYAQTINLPARTDTFYLKGDIPEGGTLSSLFYLNVSIKEIEGSLISLMGGQPRAVADFMFAGTFFRCSALTEIPEGLFSGISGAPAERMFCDTFASCHRLTGSIPAGLLSGISGPPAEYMFSGTFAECEELTEIPAGLFSGISGAPVEDMFYSTFAQCEGLREIPAGLFSGISGASVAGMAMFYRTFRGCTGLRGSVPADLFNGITGDPDWVNNDKPFLYCTGLTNPPGGT
jgi:hypothetical protein